MKKTIKYVMSLVVALTVFMGANTAFASDIFKDVSRSDKFAVHIWWFSEEGVINGYPDGTFRPNNPINRAEASKVIWNATALGELYDESIFSTRPLQKFPDVKDSDWFAPHIENMYKFKLIDGYQDGSFRPHDNMTRAEAAKLVAETFFVTNVKGDHVYPDVPKNAWYTEYVNSLYAINITDSYGTDFRPEDKITRAELTYYVAEALDWYVGEGYLLVEDEVVEQDDETEVVEEEESSYIHPVYPEKYKEIETALKNGHTALTYSVFAMTADEMDDLILEFVNNNEGKYPLVEWEVLDFGAVFLYYEREPIDWDNL